MILKGFVTNGTWTREYLEMVAKIIEDKRRYETQRTIDTPPGIIIAKR